MHFRLILLTLTILFGFGNSLKADPSDAADTARLEQAERDWICVVYHLKRGEKPSAVIYCRYIVRDAPASRRAKSAARLLVQLRDFQ